jgi:hypothetical protein
MLQKAARVEADRIRKAGRQAAAANASWHPASRPEKAQRCGYFRHYRTRTGRLPDHPKRCESASRLQAQAQADRIRNNAATKHQAGSSLLAAGGTADGWNFMDCNKMRIPTGNFGNVLPQAQPTRVDVGNTGAVGDAVAQLGERAWCR